MYRVFFAFYIKTDTIKEMRYLGIDYGKKRIGLAVSDETLAFAFPREILANQSTKQSVRAILQFAEQEHIGKIIIGLPLGSAGDDTEQTRNIRAFAALFARESHLPIEFENELLTSRLARAGSDKGKPVDASAAALILQSYLDKHK